MISSCAKCEKFTYLLESNKTGIKQTMSYKETNINAQPELSLSSSRAETWPIKLKELLY